ncbi:MAG: ATP-binding protein [Flavobacteriales bacterium]|nr:ATP-binding protein [Flavobacteriales bacterium]|tara:strand:+ start:330 stop:1007 length:678 start_codon:yes stop_codon:yes gene_type:complete
MSTVLRAENINKYFREPVLFHVLKDISFSIEQGDFISIMGKSGCGKSTLLYILSTMDTDYEGKLYLNEELLSGRSGSELSKVRNANIGFVFQFHYLLPEFSVLENVMLPAKKLGRKPLAEIEADAIENLRLLGVDKHAHKKAYRVSGGEKQRIAIARALINEPAIIMCDEPTGNLDSKNSQIVFELFDELSSRKKLSLLVVTHDEDFANKTHNIITMEDGRILSA